MASGTGIVLYGLPGFVTTKIVVTFEIRPPEIADFCGFVLLVKPFFWVWRLPCVLTKLNRNNYIRKGLAPSNSKNTKGVGGLKNCFALASFILSLDYCFYCVYCFVTVMLLYLLFFLFK